jgi:CBS-domain-containing membrane protein
MTRAPALVAIEPERSCAEAVTRAHAAGVHHLVVASHGRLEGMVSLRDICALDVADQPIKHHMHREVFALRSDATLGEAAAAMAALGVGSLPVLESDGVVAGLLTRSDLRSAGVTDSILGARRCASCGETHGVRLDPRDGAEYCLVCEERFEEFCGPSEMGEGD